MSFFNINNELVSQESILEDLIGYYQSLHDEGKSKVTDFSVGSEARTLLEVMSHIGYNLLEECNNTLSNHFISTAEGEYLDLLGANPNVNLPREQGSTATGLVKFSLDAPVTEEVTITAGVIVSNDEVSYETDVDAVIPIGETSTYVQCTCTIDGVEGNCNAGTIVNLDNVVSDYNITVTNEDAFTNGADFEEDDVYRDRLLEFVRQDNFGSRGYYENLLLGISNVHDIKESENPSATVDYVLNTNQGTDVDSVAVADALELLSNSENIVLGHTFNVSAVVSVPINVTVSINSDCGIDETDLIDIIGKYISGGDCINYPFSYPGLDMGVTLDTDSMVSEIKYITDSISSLTVSLDDSSTLDDYEAYYVESVVVTYV